MFFWVWAQKDFTSTENAFLKQAFNNAKMGHFQCLTVPQWAWAPPFFISKLKFPYDKYSVDKVWTKSRLFRRNYLKMFLQICVFLFSFSARNWEISSSETFTLNLEAAISLLKLQSNSSRQIWRQVSATQLVQPNYYSLFDWTIQTVKWYDIISLQWNDIISLHGYHF